MFQVLVGSMPFCAGVALHAWTTFVIARLFRAAPPSVKGRVPALVAVSGALALTHMVEILLWGATMARVGAVPADDAYYFAFVSYTTIGYGDIVAARDWRLLGPMAGMNGVLLFGWSTAILVETLNSALRERDVRR